MRIKRKDSVIPFRKTLAYRLLLATGSFLLLMMTAYFIVRYVNAGHNTGILVSVLASVMAVTALFYNLSEIRNARVPQSALKRARRR
jgi:hypothetical protein